MEILTGAGFAVRPDANCHNSFKEAPLRFEKSDFGEYINKPTYRISQ